MGVPATDSAEDFTRPGNITSEICRAEINVAASHRVK